MRLFDNKNSIKPYSVALVYMKCDNKGNSTEITTDLMMYMLNAHRRCNTGNACLRPTIQACSYTG